MEEFYRGSATINQQMFLYKADEELYKYVNLDMYAQVTQCIHPDDVPKLQSAMRDVDKYNEEYKLMVRVKGKSNVYKWMLMEISSGLLGVSEDKLYEVKITNISNFEEESRHIEEKNSEYETYLGLVNGLVFSYDMASEEIVIDMTIAGQHMDVHNGSIDKWITFMLDGHIASEYADEFRALGNDIKSGKKEINYTFATDVFGSDGTVKQYRFAGTTVKKESGSAKVFGVITSADNSEGFAESMAFVKDPGMDIINKKSIIDYAKRAIAIAREKKVYIVIVDLDNFKSVNDTYGHAHGDKVLSTVGEILKTAVGGKGMVGRIGGDEMMLVLDKLDEHSELRNMLRTIRTNVEWTFKGKLENISLTCSMGVANFPENGSEYEEVFELADKMLYRAKEKGKNRYVIYIPSIHDETKEEISVNSERVKVRDKIDIVYRLLEDFMIKRIMPHSNALTEIGYGFGLDEIDLCYKPKNTSVIWRDGESTSDFEEMEMYFNEEDFFDGFDKDNLLIANGMFNIEGKYPHVYEILRNKGIESALFYRIKEKNKAVGFIMFAKTSRREKWSEFDKIVLATIGKICELEIVD